MATSRSKVKVARNTHVKYGSRTCYGSKVVVKVKVFFDRQTKRQTGQKLDAHQIGDSGGIIKQI